MKSQRSEGSWSHVDMSAHDRTCPVGDPLSKPVKYQEADHIRCPRRDPDDLAAVVREHDPVSASLDCRAWTVHRAAATEISSWCTAPGSRQLLESGSDDRAFDRRVVHAETRYGEAARRV